MIAALIALSGCGSSAKLAPLATDALVLAYGDSLTYGTGANEEESYPAVLQSLIRRQVVRSGVPGELSGEGLARLPEVLDRVRPQLIILCHSGNDLLRHTGEAFAEANLRAMVRFAQARGIAVVLIAVPRPGLRLAPAGFYAAIAGDARTPVETAALADILSDNSMKSDLTHPNAAGYRKLAETVARLLKKTGAV
ncbi:MAG: GDSL-type esterase/lipase family protein [Pseudonocardiaceae bacterium]